MANVATVTTIAWDGTADSNTIVGTTSATGLFTPCSVTLMKEGLSEGYHYATINGSVVSASTGTWAAGTGIAGSFTSLLVRIGQ